MADQWGRVIAGSAALAVLWIAVYWAWEPSSPPITYGSTPPPADPANPATGPGGSATKSTPDPRSADPSPSKPPAPARPPVQTQPEGPKAVPPAYSTYRVQPGDTLKSISTRFYGTDKHFLAIAKSNPFKDPQRLKAGDEIRIPRDPNNIQGHDTPGIPGSPGNAGTAAPTTAGAPVPGTPAKTADAGPKTQTEYLVQSGDTLSAISKKFYGSTKYTDLIYEANKGELASPDDLRAGRKLVIPPKPQETKSAAGDDRR